MSSETKEIAGKEFVVSKLPFRRQRPLFQHLVRCSKDTGMSVGSLAMFSDEDLDKLQNELGASSKCEGAPLDKAGIDRVFSELGMGAYFEWLAFAIEVQFRDFFGASRVGE